MSHTPMECSGPTSEDCPRCSPGALARIIAQAPLLPEAIEALRDLMADLEHEEPDGWMSGQVHTSAVHKARAILQRYEEAAK